MGHSKIETTLASYLYSPDENKKKVVRQLDRMMKEKAESAKSLYKR